MTIFVKVIFHFKTVKTSTVFDGNLFVTICIISINGL